MSLPGDVLAPELPAEKALFMPKAFEAQAFVPSLARVLLYPRVAQGSIAGRTAGRTDWAHCLEGLQRPPLDVLRARSRTALM